MGDGREPRIHDRLAQLRFSVVGQKGGCAASWKRLLRENGATQPPVTASGHATTAPPNQRNELRRRMSPPIYADAPRVSENAEAVAASQHAAVRMSAPGNQTRVDPWSSCVFLSLALRSGHSGLRCARAPPPDRGAGLVAT